MDAGMADIRSYLYVCVQANERVTQLSIRCGGKIKY
jgi:hypothetical protein